MSEVDLYLGDCLEIIPTLEVGSVGAVITDPPYGINFKSNSSRESRYEVLKNDDKFDFFNYWSVIVSVVKNEGAIYIYCRWDVAYKWQDIINPDNQIILSRGRQNMGDLNNYSTEYEVVLFKAIGKHKIDGTELGLRNNSHAKNPPVYKRRIGNLWADVVSNEAWERGSHPTQKTVDSAKKMILISTKFGDTILDPFMGSGTTGVACVETGRNFIGIEIDKKYYTIAEERIKQAQRQMLLGI